MMNTLKQYETRQCTFDAFSDWTLQRQNNGVGTAIGLQVF